MCNTSRMPRVTRKKIRKAANQKTKTVPSIRKSFDAFHAYLRSPRSDSEIAKKFKELFGKKISKQEVAKVMAMKMPQRGGMAPLDYAMGSPDARLSAVPYVQRGFGFANINSLTEGSPKEYLGSTPQMGGKRSSRKQRGGGGNPADTAAAFGAQPFGMGAPPSIAQGAAYLSTGGNLLPSPIAEINPLSIKPPVFVHGAKLV